MKFFKAQYWLFLLPILLVSCVSPQSDNEYHDGENPSAGDVPSNSVGDMPMGKYGLSLPDTMEVGQAARVTLLIGTVLEDSALKKALLENVPPQEQAEWQVFTEEIQIASKMRARLQAPQTEIFEINSLTDPEQYIELAEDQTTNWTWFVKPLKPGQHELFLDIAILKGPDATPRSIRVAERLITVRATAIAKEQAPKYGLWGGMGAGAALLFIGIRWLLSRRKKAPTDAQLLDGSVFGQSRYRLKQGNVPMALEVLEKFYEEKLAQQGTEQNPDDEEVYNAVLLHTSRLRRAMADYDEGKIGKDDLNQTENRVSAAVLKLIDKWEHEG